MQQEREWKLVFSWKGVGIQLVIAALFGKFFSYISSDFFQLNWIACALWMLSTGWLASAFSSYREESLSYFDGQSGRFQPRFQKRSRRQIFGAFFIVAVAFAVLGVLVQVYF